MKISLSVTTSIAERALVEAQYAWFGKLKEPRCLVLNHRVFCNWFVV